MAAAKKQGRKFTANVKVTVIVGMELTAQTLEDALAEARDLDTDDCVEVLGENVDWTHSLVSVSSDEWISY